MALDATRLAQAWYDIESEYNEQDIAEDQIEATRLEINQRKAQALIDEITQHLKINYTSGLVAPNGAVTGSLNHTVQ
jgi:hypothetical protein